MRAMRERRVSYDASLSWSGTSFEQRYRTLQRDRAELAANGLGGPGCTPNGRADFDFRHAAGPLGGLLPTFWNVSNGALGDGMTQVFFPGFVFTTRESLSLALTSNNHGQGGCEFYNPFLTALRSEVMTLPGGMAEMAAGAQVRRQTNASRAPAINFPGLPNAILGYDDTGRPSQTHYVSNNFECAGCIFNYEHARTVRALFTELSLPLLPDVDTQIALRWEDYSGQIGSEVTPKIAARWRVSPALMVRGSFSQSWRRDWKHPSMFSGIRYAIRRSGRDSCRRVTTMPCPTSLTRSACPNLLWAMNMPIPSILGHCGRLAVRWTV